jgi:hypothetical protein
MQQGVSFLRQRGVNDDPVKGMMNQKRREIKLFFCEYSKDRVSYSDTQYRELIGMLLERVFGGFFLDLGMGRGLRKAAENAQRRFYHMVCLNKCS